MSNNNRYCRYCGHNLQYCGCECDNGDGGCCFIVIIFLLLWLLGLIKC